MTLGSERGAVQNPFIRYAVEAGWTHIAPNDLMTGKGLCERLPLGIDQVRSLLRTLKRREQAHSVGNTSAGRWYPGSKPRRTK